MKKIIKFFLIIFIIYVLISIIGAVAYLLFPSLREEKIEETIDVEASEDGYAVYSRGVSSKYGSASTIYLVFDISNNKFYRFTDALKSITSSFSSLRKGNYKGSFDSQIDLEYDDERGNIISYDAHNGVISRTYISVFSDEEESDSYAIEKSDSQDRAEAIEILEQYFEIKAKHDAYEQNLSEKYQIVSFGSYEQDKNTENGKEPIKWLVLEQHGDYSYLLSLYILDFQKPFDHTMTEHTLLWKQWGGSTLRQWLNSDFYNTAFSLEEQPYIKETSHIVNHPWEPKAKLPTEETLVDKVFLLSRDEVVKYFEGDQMSARKTDAQLGYNAATRHGYYKWLTLSDRDTTNWFCVVEDRLDTNYYDDEAGVRPAMWVSTSRLHSTNPDFKW